MVTALLAITPLPESMAPLLTVSAPVPSMASLAVLFRQSSPPLTLHGPENEPVPLYVILHEPTFEKAVLRCESRSVMVPSKVKWWSSLLPILYVAVPVTLAWLLKSHPALVRSPLPVTAPMVQVRPGTLATPHP